MNSSSQCFNIIPAWSSQILCLHCCWNMFVLGLHLWLTTWHPATRYSIFLELSFHTTMSLCSPCLYYLLNLVDRAFKVYICSVKKFLRGDLSSLCGWTFSFDWWKPKLASSKFFSGRKGHYVRFNVRAHSILYKSRWDGFSWPVWFKILFTASIK